MRHWSLPSLSCSCSGLVFDRLDVLYIRNKSEWDGERACGTAHFLRVLSSIAVRC
jgi:hypothetical protein